MPEYSYVVVPYSDPSGYRRTDNSRFTSSNAGIRYTSEYTGFNLSNTSRTESTSSGATTSSSTNGAHSLTTSSRSAWTEGSVASSVYASGRTTVNSTGGSTTFSTSGGGSVSVATTQLVTPQVETTTTIENSRVVTSNTTVNTTIHTEAAATLTVTTSTATPPGTTTFTTTDSGAGTVPTTVQTTTTANQLTYAIETFVDTVTIESYDNVTIAKSETTARVWTPSCGKVLTGAGSHGVIAASDVGTVAALTLTHNKSFVVVSGSESPQVLTIGGGGEASFVAVTANEVTATWMTTVWNSYSTVERVGYGTTWTDTLYRSELASTEQLFQQETTTDAGTSAESYTQATTCAINTYELPGIVVSLQENRLLLSQAEESFYNSHMESRNYPNHSKYNVTVTGVGSGTRTSGGASSGRSATFNQVDSVSYLNETGIDGMFHGSVAAYIPVKPRGWQPAGAEGVASPAYRSLSLTPGTSACRWDTRSFRDGLSNDYQERTALGIVSPRATSNGVTGVDELTNTGFKFDEATYISGGNEDRFVACFPNGGVATLDFLPGWYKGTKQDHTGGTTATSFLFNQKASTTTTGNIVLEIMPFAILVPGNGGVLMQCPATA